MSKRKYVVDPFGILDIVGELPVILMEIEPAGGNIMKTYIYGNSQVLAQHNGPHTAAKYFYLHDRLGSVRQIINTSGLVQKYYTYEPFGQSIESGGTFADPFRFTGQFYDEEIAEYYLRARQYNPAIARFTARDPVFGDFVQPLTLHKYLYCGNNPINGIDPAGQKTFHVMFSAMFSPGFSLMYQKGIVFDDKGNVGWITTSNDPAWDDITPPGEPKYGLGAGIPAASAGVAFGFTTADTILDLQGPGMSVGASIGTGFSIGADYIRGIQRSGEYYHGFEVTPAYGGGAFGFEAHGHATWTRVDPWASNREQGIDVVRASVENSIYDVRTVGQGYAALFIWAYLQ